MYLGLVFAFARVQRPAACGVQSAASSLQHAGEVQLHRWQRFEGWIPLVGPLRGKSCTTKTMPLPTFVMNHRCASPVGLARTKNTGRARRNAV